MRALDSEKSGFGSKRPSHYRCGSFFIKPLVQAEMIKHTTKWSICFLYFIFVCTLGLINNEENKQISNPCSLVLSIRYTTFFLYWFSIRYTCSSFPCSCYCNHCSLGYSYFNTRKTCLMKNMRNLQLLKTKCQ